MTKLNGSNGPVKSASKPYLKPQSDCNNTNHPKCGKRPLKLLLLLEVLDNPCSLSSFSLLQGIYGVALHHLGPQCLLLGRLNDRPRRLVRNKFWSFGNGLWSLGLGRLLGRFVGPLRWLVHLLGSFARSLLRSFGRRLGRFLGKARSFGSLWRLHGFLYSFFKALPRRCPVSCQVQINTLSRVKSIFTDLTFTKKIKVTNTMSKRMSMQVSGSLEAYIG